MSVLLFCVFLVAGRIPAIGFANDHGFGLVAAASIAAGFAIVEMIIVLHLFERISRLRRLRAKLLRSKQAGSPVGYIGMLTPLLFPIGGGIWAALALAILLGFSLKRAVPIIGLANGVSFGLYYATLAKFAWYLVGILAIIALVTWLVRRYSTRLQPA